MSFQRFLAILALALFASSMVSATSIVDVRLSHNTLDKSERALYVDIEVRLDNQDRMVLAGQNYRIYYPTETLSLNKKGSKSQLSKEQYSNLQFAKVLEHVSASGQGNISFDEDLGFANFSVELLDNQKGGASLSDKDGWVTIATLKFDVLGEFEEVSMVWGRESMSAKYATAFVEIAEWEAPLRTSTVTIDEYIDFNLVVNSLSLEGITYDISVGPNPTTDFVEISSDKALLSDMNVAIRDISGKLLKSQQLLKGSNTYTLDVSTLLSAPYILDMSDESGNNLLTKRILVTQ